MVRRHCEASDAGAASLRGQRLCLAEPRGLEFFALLGGGVKEPGWLTRSSRGIGWRRLATANATHNLDGGAGNCRQAPGRPAYLHRRARRPHPKLHRTSASPGECKSMGWRPAVNWVPCVAFLVKRLLRTGKLSPNSPPSGRSFLDPDLWTTRYPFDALYAQMRRKPGRRQCFVSPWFSSMAEISGSRPRKSRNICA